MLVLSRTRGQAVMIGDQIVVTVVDMRGDKVRLGISAPKEVSVHRQEIYEAIKGQNIASSGVKPADLPASVPPPVRQAVSVASKPELSSLLKAWKDPVSGVESYILSERVAPIQQAFAVGPGGLSGDGKYLWFYCSFPPAGSARQGRFLGVADLYDPDMRFFPETQFDEDSPRVDPQTGEVLWRYGAAWYKRGPRRSDKTAAASNGNAIAVSAAPPLQYEPRVEQGSSGVRVMLRNPTTEKTAIIVSHMAAPPPETFSYDPVPHPHLSADGRYLFYTTTVLGRVDVALVPMGAVVGALG